MVAEGLLVSVLGLAMGSFLTLVTERLDTMESFVSGRSHCNNCKKTLRWWELMPVLSYVLFRGKCVRCNKAIPHVYPLLELVTAVTFYLVWLAQPQPMNYWLLGVELLVVSVLLVLFFYDIFNQAFPLHTLTVALVGVILLMVARVSLNEADIALLQFADPLLGWLSSPGSVITTLIAGMLVGLISLGALALPSREKWMGYGDVLLAGILGIWLGYPFILVALVAAFYIGAIVSLALLALRKVGDDHRIAFGPFLIAGALIARVWGEPIMRYIVQFIGGS